jgi:hypothetical protein
VKKAAMDHIMKKWQNRWNFSNRGRFYHNFHHQVKTKNLHDFPNKNIVSVSETSSFTPTVRSTFILRCIEPDNKNML